MKGKVKWIVLRLALVAVVALVVAAPARPAAASPNAVVLPPSTNPYGHTYGEWSNLWWQWAFSLPVRQGFEQNNPLFDTTGAACSKNQTGTVWFLAGVFALFSPQPAQSLDPVPLVVRDKCVVPSGKALFIPVVNSEDDNSYDANRTESDIRQAVQTVLAGIDQHSATVDGTPIQDYFVGADNAATSVTMPKYNLYSYYGVPVSPGTYYPMVTGGYYFMLAPLSSGQHTIHFEGHGSSTLGDFGVNVTYILTVR